MIAETPFNVIEALPEKEYKRLMNMLGVEIKPKRVKNEVGISKAESVEYLSRYCKNKNHPTKHLKKEQEL